MYQIQISLQIPKPTRLIQALVNNPGFLVQRKNMTRNVYVVLQIQFYAWLVNLIKKMHVQIIYHRIKNNAYSNVCLNKRIFF